MRESRSSDARELMEKQIYDWAISDDPNEKSTAGEIYINSLCSYETDEPILLPSYYSLRGLINGQPAKCNRFTPGIGPSSTFAEDGYLISVLNRRETTGDPNKNPLGNGNFNSFISGLKLKGNYIANLLDYNCAEISELCDMYMEYPRNIAISINNGSVLGNIHDIDCTMERDDNLPRGTFIEAVNASAISVRRVNVSNAEVVFNVIGGWRFHASGKFEGSETVLSANSARDLRIESYQVFNGRGGRKPIIEVSHSQGVADLIITRFPRDYFPHIVVNGTRHEIPYDFTKSRGKRVIIEFAGNEFSFHPQY